MQVLESQDEGASAVSASTSSAISRSMRSRVAPMSSRCSVSRSPESRSHGICTSQVGACRRKSGTSRPAALPRQSRASASSTGRYGSLVPYVSTHCPWAIHTRGSAATRSRKASTTRRLADACLARQERDLASATPSRVEPRLQAIQGALPADEMPRAFGSHSASELGVGGRERRGLIAGTSPVSGIGDAGDEPVSEPMHGGDVPGRAGRITEGLPDLPHTDLQHGIADHRRRPDGFEKGFLGDQLTGVLDEALEHRECLGGKADRFRAPPQARADRVQPE
mgnify:CR=1 FL=1